MTQLESILELNINNLCKPSDHVLAAGQPSPEQLQALKDSGVEHVINLRPHDEIDWDEETLVQKLGMQYHHLPIQGKTDITFSNAAKLDDILTRTQNELSLLHCGSSNRVGALVALQAYTDGETLESAIKVGKDWGLTALEDYTRGLLSSEAKN